MGDTKKDLINRIRDNAQNFSASDHLIADYLLQEYPRSFLQNASGIAAKLNINVATVVRFFPKLGYKSAKNAMRLFKEEISFLIDSPLDRYRQPLQGKDESVDKISMDTMNLDWDNMRQSMESMDKTHFDKTVHLLADVNRTVFSMGMMKEHCLAYYFYYQMSKFTDNCYLFNSLDLLETLPKMKPGDILFSFDFRRYHSLHRKVMEYAKKIGAVNIIVSDSPLSPSISKADYSFFMETSGLHAFDSYTGAMCFINAIINTLTERYGAPLKKKYQRMEKIYSCLDVFDASK